MAQVVLVGHPSYLVHVALEGVLVESMIKEVSHIISLIMPQPHSLSPILITYRYERRALEYLGFRKFQTSQSLIVH